MADIFGVRVTADLNILDTLIIICNTAGGQTEPAVTFAGQNYFVTWLDQAFQTRNSPVAVARVNPQGIVLDSVSHIGTGDYHPDIAFDGNRCLAVWSKEFHGVVGRFVNASGQPEGQAIDISLTQGTSTEPVIDYGTQDYLVVWADFCQSGTDLDIYGQLVSSAGQLVGDRIAIAEGTPMQSYPAVTFDGGQFLVVWIEDEDYVYGRFVTEGGIPSDTAFMISNNTAYERQHTTVAAGTDHALVAWNEYHYDFDVYGNLDVHLGVEEEEHWATPEAYTTTWSGIEKSTGQDCLIYDISGRNIPESAVTQGVYFLKTDKKVVRKVVIIR